MSAAVPQVSTGSARPCPHCNCASVAVEHDATIFSGQTYEGESSNEGWKLRCDNCGAQTCWWHRKEQATIAWNARVSISAVAQGSPDRDAIALDAAHQIEALPRVNVPEPQKTAAIQLVVLEAINLAQPLPAGDKACPYAGKDYCVLEESSFGPCLCANPLAAPQPASNAGGEDIAKAIAQALVDADLTTPDRTVVYAATQKVVAAVLSSAPHARASAYSAPDCGKWRPNIVDLADKIRTAKISQIGQERFAVINLLIPEADMDGFADAIDASSLSSTQREGGA